MRNMGAHGGGTWWGHMVGAHGGGTWYGGYGAEASRRKPGAGRGMAAWRRGGVAAWHGVTEIIPLHFI